MELRGRRPSYLKNGRGASCKLLCLDVLDTVWATSEASMLWFNQRGHLSLIRPLVEEMSVSTNNSNKDTYLNG